MIRNIVIGLVGLLVVGGGLYAVLSGGDEAGSAATQQSESVAAHKGESQGAGDAPSAQEPANGQVWVKRCEKDKVHCEVFQRLVIKETQKRLIEIAIGFDENDSGKGRLAMIAPLGISLADGVTLQIEGADDIKLPIKTCTENGCVSLSEISADTLNAMKKTDKMTAVLKDGAGKSIKVIMSLKGFEGALAQLK